jgi:hypothetical protein
VVLAIKEKRNTDFCGVYELYYHDKVKRECFMSQHVTEQMVAGANSHKKKFISLKSYLRSLRQKPDQGSAEMQQRY